MNLKEVKSYVEGTIKQYFKPKVLNKFDEDTDGNLTYDGNSISAKVSGKSNNAIQTITDTTTPSNGGLFVKDLSEEVKRINIAQKTVNNPSWELISNDIIIQATPSTENGEANSTDLNIDEVLLKSIEDYEFLDFYIQPIGTTTARSAQIVRVSVNTIIYNNSNTFSNNDGSCFSVQFNYHSMLKGLGGARHASLIAYFKNPTTLRLYQFINTFETSDANKFKIWVKGVYTDRITIDPVNYIDTTQGIQDTPVGEIIEVIGDKELKHYLLCDGSTQTIGTYPNLEQHFKEIESINLFGGDGITTYKLPYVEPKPYITKSLLPEMTSNNTPSPYVASSSSIYSAPYQAFNAFNSKEGDVNACWHSLSNSAHWLQIDYGSPKKINSFKLKGRISYSQWYNQMPISFKLQGSNDGTTFTNIKTFSGLSWGSNIEQKFELSNTVEYRYYKLADMVSNTDFVCLNKVEYLHDVYKYTYIKYEPTYFIGRIYGREEIIDLSNGFIDIANGQKFNFKLNQSIENFDKIEATIEATWKNSGTKLGLSTRYFNVSDIKDRYTPSGVWQDGNQLNYISTLIDGEIAEVTAIFKNGTDVVLSGYGRNLNASITKLHVRIRGIRVAYVIK